MQTSHCSLPAPSTIRERFGWVVCRYWRTLIFCAKTYEAIDSYRQGTRPCRKERQLQQLRTAATNFGKHSEQRKELRKSTGIPTNLGRRIVIPFCAKTARGRWCKPRSQLSFEKQKLKPTRSALKLPPNEQTQNASDGFRDCRWRGAGTGCGTGRSLPPNRAKDRATKSIIRHRAGIF